MLAKKLILVVEDNEINRMILSGLLSSEYEVLEAENGQAALEILADRKDDISLILLDINMPVMDGYRFLSIAKADESLASIPVIVTTQSDSEADEVSALSHGATDFVAKPYKAQIILHRVASIIHLRETASMINQFQYDRLTGIYSKEFFYQRVRETLRQNPDRHYDILCSDIENFKLINDVFGVAAGDQLLCGIADLYREIAKGTEAYGRLGADQFVCMVEARDHYTDEMFIKIGEKINSFPNAKNVVVKWGVYAIRSNDVTVEQMCDRALLAARSIKGQYGKYFADYDDKLRNELLRQQAIIDSMETALKEQQFQVYLQPKYRIWDERLAGAEALVRWNHSEWGFMSPAEFIPLFEKNGFITKLDQFVWEKTCFYMQEWDKKGYPPIPISVNVSRADIYNADIVDILMHIIKKYNIQPSRLHLEITESAYTENPNQIIETVARLRKSGFVIEMDDFGSGYSSLNMLNQMSVDILKLDMKFIQSETSKPVSQGVLRFIMELARWLNLSVVAEGVETKEQLDRLLEIGCDYVQGYYFSRPVPEEEFEKILVGSFKADNSKIKVKEVGIKRQVLLVADENREYRDQVSRLFSKYYCVEEAADGQSAMAVIERTQDQMAIALVSGDLPDAGGLSLLRNVKSNKDIWNVPMIITGKPDMEIEKEALEGGAADYAVKPHAAETLIKRVRRAVRLSSFPKREQDLKNQAYRDHLTNLLNRRGWEAALGSLPKEEAPFAIYFFDLDNLQRLNDRYGHMQGDRALQEFARVLRSHTRETDIVSRFGGDEFMVIMKSMRSDKDAMKKGEEICKAFAESSLEEKDNVTVSVGMAMWDGKGLVDDILNRTVKALGRAKDTCKGGCCLWKE